MLKGIVVGLTLFQAAFSLRIVHLDANDDVEKAFNVCNYNRNDILEEGE